MKTLKTYEHDDYKKIENPKLYKRIAARGVILKGDEILLIYTKRYNDYSLPGGGVDEGESLTDGLLRELAEETGAKNIRILGELGCYEEYRPTYYDGYDLMHMLSYCYVCDADYELGDAEPEEYEVNNGSVPVWVNIHKAIEYNNDVINKNENTMGLSIRRETFLLEYIKDNIL